MAYEILLIPETSGGFDAESTLNRRWRRRRRTLGPGFRLLHDAVWTPEGWRRSAMVGRLSLRGCLIARRLGGNKREVRSGLRSSPPGPQPGLPRRRAWTPASHDASEAASLIPANWLKARSGKPARMVA